MTGCDSLRLSLGAYAIGTLEPADENAVETHLASCPTCLNELAELQSVVPALAGLSREDLAPPVPSPDLFDRIVTAAEMTPGNDVTPLARTRRPSTRWLLAAAAAVVVLAGGGTAVGFAVANSSSHATATVANGTSGNVRLRVEATATDTGSRLELTARGLPTHEHCHLIAWAADGSRHEAGSWKASYEGGAKVTESTDVAPSQLRRLVLFGDDKQRLVVVNV